jgi:hypothetical protein
VKDDAAQIVQRLDDLEARPGLPARCTARTLENAADREGPGRHASCSKVTMADAPSDPLDAETRRVTQPTIAFHHQPTVAIGPNDLARELFRQSTSSSTFRRPLARSASWDLPTVAKSRPERGRLRAALVCVACLLLGVGAGHAVREGRAYAAGPERSITAHTASVAVSAPRDREARVVSDAHAVASGTARGKDVTANVAPSARPTARRTRGVRPAVAAAARTASPAEADALFLDFEPTFRVGR